MSCTDCNETNVPEVDNSSVECCELTPTNCVITSEAVPCLKIGKGDTLTKLFKRLCKYLNRLGFLDLIDTPNSYTNQEGNVVVVNQDGDGVTFENRVGLYESVSLLESSDILSIDSSPFELLPNPGVGNYYRIIDSTVEYTAGSTPYTPASATLDILVDNYQRQHFPINTSNNVTANDFIKGTDSPSTPILNTALTLSTLSGDALVGGDGTLKVKIIYTIEEF